MKRSRPDISVLLPDEATVRARRDALTDLLQTRDRRRRRVWTRRALIAVASLFVLSAAVAAAAGVFSADDVAVDAGIGCYDRASLHGNVTITHATADPVAKCAAYWRQGVVDVDAPPRAPHLVACTGENQAVSVFPGTDAVCRRLGLVPLPADYAPAGAAFARAYAALLSLRRIPAATSDCPSAQEQADLARARLSGAYQDVRVAIQGSEPCGGGYKIANDHIVVVTVSEDRGRANHAAFLRRAGSRR